MNVSFLWILAVLAVIAVMASMMLPSLKQARIEAFHKKLNPLDTLLSSLDPGQIAFGAPGRMGYGETKTVTLLLSKIKSISELEQSLAGSEIVQGHTVKVADVMEAHLTGMDFDIVPTTPEVQSISGRETTEWSWQVKPKEFGRLPLRLSLNAKFVVDDKEQTHTIRTFEETITVTVAWPRSVLVFLRHNWQWLCTAILIPVAIWIGRRVWKSKKKKHENMNGAGTPKQIE
jgi:hypothetical protein